MTKQFIGGGIFVLLCSISAFSQNTAPTPQNQPSTQNETPANAENSDLVITANVRARELKFEVVPNPTVEFPGTPARQTVWEADRENLPRPVEPNVTYRDVGVKLRIYSRFAEIQRIVVEAIDAENAQIVAPKPENNPPTVPAKNNLTPAAPKVAVALAKPRKVRKNQ